MTLATRELTVYTVVDQLESIVNLVLDSCNSQNTRRSYRLSLQKFLDWYTARGRPELRKAVLNQYRAELQAENLSNASINLRMAAVRKLITEAADNDLIDPSAANSALRVKGLPHRGNKAGLWMTREQAERLINAPDIHTIRGARDRAILAVMIGAGLRREEVTNLETRHIQIRDNRPAIVDIMGKGSKTRTIPIPVWTHLAIQHWLKVSGIQTGTIFTSLDRKFIKARQARRMTTQAVHLTVARYAGLIGLPDLACHDCRRTFAKLAYRGGAALPQIQMSLGHSSLTTTQRYLGSDQSFEDAPADHLGLRL